MAELRAELLAELAEIQNGFDGRIPTVNLSDSVMAYFVELFEWVNAHEKMFKNWKANPGKGFAVEIEELADVTAFGLSIANQVTSEYDESIESLMELVEYHFDDMADAFVLDNPTTFLAYISTILGAMFNGPNAAIGLDEVSVIVMLPFIIAEKLYTQEDLVKAYKAKMEINHARQDGTVDTEKGYV